jgi:hypothetical protein
MTKNYQEFIKTYDQALAHLFFYCCFRDGEFNEAEITDVTDILVSSGLNKSLPLKEEILHYREYAPALTDRIGYLTYLVNLVKPAHPLALYSYCVELCLSDKVLQPAEADLLEQLAEVLSLPKTEALTISKLVVEINDVQEENHF